MIWLLIPLGWVLASITILFGVHHFLKAEDERIATLDRRSERVRQRIEREMRPQSEIDRERAAWATQAQGLAWAQQNALQAYSGNSQANCYGNQQMALLGGGFNSLFGMGGFFR